MPLSLPYVAGLLDGEGCIQFARTRQHIYPRVLITNTNREVLEELQNQFGGDIRPLSLRKSGWKQGYNLRIGNRLAIKFLTKIYRWLRIKEEQAWMVFAWDIVRPGKGHRHTKDSIEAIDLLQKRMKWLNMKGPRTGEDPFDHILRETGYA